jgi:hypothetical protein
VRGKRAAPATGTRRTGIAVAVAVLGLVVLGFYLWAGYVAGWGWTGLSSDVALWDWLEAIAWDWLKLLLLPVLVPTVLLPVLQRFVERSATAEESSD